MDATFRNLGEESFRKFKAKCAQHGLPMGGVLSELMAQWAAGKVHVKLGPDVGASTRSLSGKRQAHTMRDLGDHLRLLRTWNEVSHHAKHHKHRK